MNTVLDTYEELKTMESKDRTQMFLAHYMAIRPIVEPMTVKDHLDNCTAEVREIINSWIRKTVN
jgi:hypothetical protein|tara:strand:- start:22799 stop:22990 length:192 start_codon:yes stop_codon:yes gene_type:complete